MVRSRRQVCRKNTCVFILVCIGLLYGSRTMWSGRVGEHYRLYLGNRGRRGDQARTEEREDVMVRCEWQKIKQVGHAPFSRHSTYQHSPITQMLDQKFPTQQLTSTSQAATATAHQHWSPSPRPWRHCRTVMAAAR